MLVFDNKMLQAADTWTEISRNTSKLKPYNASSLKGRDPYVDFLRELAGAGVLGVTNRCRGRVGAFAVSKKPKFLNGVKVERQRLVLDAGRQMHYLGLHHTLS